jgi:hypothetical protein
MADLSSRAVVPSVVCLSVIVNEEALANYALLRHEKKPVLSRNTLQYTRFPLLIYLLFSQQYFMPFPFSPEEVM